MRALARARARPRVLARMRACMQGMYTDTCCKGRLDPATGLIPTIFEGEEFHGTSKDFWHAQTKVGDGIDSAFPKRKSSILSRISAIAMKRRSEDIDDVASWLITTKPYTTKNVPAAHLLREAQEDAKTNDKYKIHIRDHISNEPELETQYAFAHLQVVFDTCTHTCTRKDMRDACSGFARCITMS